jgi:hypothetical protein
MIRSVSDLEPTHLYVESGGVRLEDPQRFVGDLP